MWRHTKSRCIGWGAGTYLVWQWHDNVNLRTSLLNDSTCSLLLTASTEEARSSLIGSPSSEARSAVRGQRSEVPRWLDVLTQSIAHAVFFQHIHTRYNVGLKMFTFTFVLGGLKKLKIAFLCHILCVMSLCSQPCALHWCFYCCWYNLLHYIYHGLLSGSVGDHVCLQDKIQNYITSSFQPLCIVWGGGH